MPNFSASLNITTGRGDTLSASKTGNYEDILNIRQRVDNTNTHILMITGASGKGAATLPDSKSLIIKNTGNVGAEILIQSLTHTDGTPDTTGAAAFQKYLLGSKDFIYLPNIRQMYGTTTSSSANAYTIDGSPSSNMYEALDNAAGGDPQLLNEDVDSGAETAINVDEGAYFYEGDLIRLENEICEVVSISSNTITVIRGTHGSTKATHADDVAIRLPFFNAYADFDKFSVAQTDSSGRFKAMNFFGKARNTDGSGNKESMGLVAGSFSMKFYESGYQELGLSNITSATSTGLTASQQYLIDITVDNGTKFQDLTFTTDSSDLSFGKVITLINDALNTQFYTAGNLFEKRVTVSIVNGDVRFTSGSHLSTSAILIEDTGDANSLFDASAIGRFPSAGTIEAPVAARLPKDTIIDGKSGISIQNVANMAYDDGYGVIKGVANGTLNYETGAINFTGKPNAEFTVAVSYGSSQSGGNRFSTDDGNCITAISARSVNSKIDTTIEVIGLQ